MSLEVTIQEGAGSTQHRVTLDADTLQRLGAGYSPEHFVRAAFRFLLDREPKEAILGNFNLKVIAQYFPEFDREIGTYLAS
ncbi:MAG: hypothetical protein HYY48_00785 [Gammaproteobacteria bacterium]|nr:hypothetical protein [Gammaproteobacteria bacterium]